MQAMEQQKQHICHLIRLHATFFNLWTLSTSQAPSCCLGKAICVHHGWHLLAAWLGAWNIHLFSYDKATWDRGLQRDIKQSPSRLNDTSPQWKHCSAHIPCPPTPLVHHKATGAFLWQGGGGESQETGLVALACPPDFILTQLICLQGV